RVAHVADELDVLVVTGGWRRLSAGRAGEAEQQARQQREQDEDSPHVTPLWVLREGWESTGHGSTPIRVAAPHGGSGNHMGVTRRDQDLDAACRDGRDGIAVTAVDVGGPSGGTGRRSGGTVTAGT